MKKTLFVTSILLASGSVMADVQLYGNVSAGVEHTKGAEPRTVVSSDGSYIGFKGAEALGAGTEAIWQIEQGVEFGSNDGRSATNLRENMRDSFIGLRKEGVGSLKLGKMGLPYTKMTEKMDLNPDRNASINGFYGRTEKRNNGSIVLETAPLGGVAVAIGHSQDNRISELSGFENKTKTTSATLQYDNYGFEAGLGYEHATDFALPDDKKQNVAGQLGYKFSNGSFVRSAYETMRYKAVNKVKQDVVSVTAGAPIGVVDLSVNYTRPLKMKINNEKVGGDANIYTAQAKYNLSKRTDIRANYTLIDNRNSAYFFPNSTAPDFGKNQHNYGVSLNHKF